MDIDLAHDKSQRVLRQRNGLALLSLVLGLVAVGSVVSAGRKDREVVLVPTLRAPVTLTSAKVSPDYLEMVTRDVALVALNRSPQSLTYWMDSILEVTDEQARGQVKKALMKVVAEQQSSQITQFFTPDGMQVDPDHLTSTVGGTLHTVVASKEVTSEHRTFRFTWTYNGISLKLKGFGMIAKPEETP
ncbi:MULTISPECIES: type IV conjugative transfer system protein TraE [unclassified Sphingomonas]|jgi:conjugal transfer pilus assembly protein TraE|uniref:type IV conjugative transfer system protein TraE n=1 Tax=Novosphingobium rhizosphaerae TaxID=1551649 RepID=UPI0015C71081